MQEIEPTQGTEIYVVGSKAGGAEPSMSFEIEVPLYLELYTGFGVCLAWFSSCFSPVWPHDGPIPPFWNWDVYSVPLYIGYI